jgi:hypothetical protein
MLGNSTYDSPLILLFGQAVPALPLTEEEKLNKKKGRIIRVTQQVFIILLSLYSPLMHKSI